MVTPGSNHSPLEKYDDKCLVKRNQKSETQQTKAKPLRWTEQQRVGKPAPQQVGRTKSYGGKQAHATLGNQNISTVGKQKRDTVGIKSQSRRA